MATVSMVQVSHIVWDWNGTLLHDNEVVLAAVNEVCAAFGRTPLLQSARRALAWRPVP